MTATKTVEKADTATAPTTLALMDGYLACGDCGQATPRPANHRPGQPPKVFTVNAFRALSQPVGFANPAVEISLTRCPVCAGRRERAQAACGRNPAIGRRLGSVATHRVAHLLSALAAIGVGITDDALDRDLPTMLRVMGPVVGLVTWSSGCGPILLPGFGRGRAAAAPWAAVDPSVIDQVRGGWGRVLAEKVAASAPPVKVPVPPGGPPGCAICGVRSVAVPAAVLARTTAEGQDVWAPIRIPLGDERPSGHLCPPCDAAHLRIGSWGPTCFERAYLAFLEATGHADEARSLRNALTDVNPPRIISFAGLWYAAGRKGLPVPTGSARPWAHVKVG